ncbi:hypothetical protein NQ317_014972 [Molorchus minor]|uniref:Uncharacterized protein n=1 Tax=Molorchus minor TaxID=1323400 RepID=A0ABQ9J3B9_9CUCU|nr:hypothetical protein NQ317_014972 [Molorchus minor]
MVEDFETLLAKNNSFNQWKCQKSTMFSMWLVFISKIAELHFYDRKRFDVIPISTIIAHCEVTSPK